MYEFQCVSDVTNLNKNIVFGMFTWDDNTCFADVNSEIDVEISKWGGSAMNTPLQFALQPDFNNQCDNSIGNNRLQRNVLNLLSPPNSTYSFYWQSNNITWWSNQGTNNPVPRWKYENLANGYRAKCPDGNCSSYITIPAPGNSTHMNINLWLYDANSVQGIPPSDGKEVEVVIKKATYCPVVAPVDYVAYYPFNSNVLDESGNGNNGTLHGPAFATDRFGNTGKAIFFDGINDWMTIEHSSFFNFDIDNSYTFSFWAKVVPTTHSEMGLIEKWGYYVGTPYPIMIRLVAGKVGFAIYQVGLGWNGVDGTTSLNRIDNDSWTHVACVKDGASSLKLYINGVLESEDNDLLYRTTYNDHRFELGNYGSYLNGCLDDIKIYKRALSNCEIQFLYHEGGW